MYIFLIGANAWMIVAIILLVLIPIIICVIILIHVLVILKWNKVKKRRGQN